MDTSTILILTFVSLVAAFFGYLFGSSKNCALPEWELVNVDPAGRGPNADKYYYVVRMKDGPYAFSDKVIEVGKERGGKFIK